MKCPRCRKDVQKGWDFCPQCGAMIMNNMISDVMAKMNEQMQETKKLFNKDFEVFDLSPYLRKGSGAGFSIKIIKSNHDSPRVSIKTFGNIDKEKLEKQVCRELGTKPLVSSKQEKRGFLDKLGLPTKGRPAQKVDMPAPKKTEEPKTEIKKLDSKVIVSMQMPGIKSGNDIKISELENSIEVRAIAGNKAYFKILTKPEEFRMVSRKFSGNRLTLEFS